MRKNKPEWYTLVWDFGSTNSAHPELFSEAKKSDISVMVFSQYTGKPFLRMASDRTTAANFLRIAVRTAGMGNITVNQ